jgi:hypothetical protein
MVDSASGSSCTRHRRIPDVDTVTDFLVALLHRKPVLPPVPAGWHALIRRSKGNECFAFRGRLCSVDLLDHRGKFVSPIGIAMAEAECEAVALRRIGLPPERIVRRGLAPRWRAACPSCRKEFTRDRRSTTSCSSCSSTFDERYLLTWERNPDDATASLAALDRGRA